MCQSTATVSPGASGDPTIYSMPSNNPVAAALAARATDGPDASTISFTDNGSFYVSTTTQAPTDANGTVSGSVALMGVSGVDGAITGVNVQDITMPCGTDGNPTTNQLSMVFNMTAPRQAAVRFTFDVNANSVSLSSATPVDTAGRPVADAAALGLDFSTIWCVTKNGGTAILPALISALPSLIGGPGAFVAAVMAAMPGAAIKTVQSVIANCFS